VARRIGVDSAATTTAKECHANDENWLFVYFLALVGGY